MSARKSASAKSRGEKDKEAVMYEVKDIVLGKVRGYAPWPGMVVDPENVPPAVAEDRPSNRKTTFYCVRFFPTGDYAWLVEKDISKLQPHEIDAYVGDPPAKKNQDLLEGYRIAKDPTKWLEQREAMASEAAEQEENAEVDQLNSDGEAPASSKSKKRKRESEAGSASARVKKAAGKKEKKEAGGSASAKKSASARGVRKNGTKSKEIVESEDDGEGDAADEDAGPSKKVSPPPAKKARREKEDEGEDAKTDDPEAVKVRDWRHKLQKSFLSNKAVPKDEDMPALDELFKAVETFEGMTIEHLQFSKIGKVMRHIAALPDDKVPRDAEFKFRERSDVLVKRWHQILNATKANGAEAASAAGLGPAPNGSTKGDKKKGADSKDSKTSKEEKEDAKSVTDGTAALDLNGKDEDLKDAPEDAMADAPGEADTSALGDVTMSDA